MSHDSIVDSNCCLRLSDVCVICSVNNIHICIAPYGRNFRGAVVNRRRTSQKIGEVSCMECKGQENDFELIPTGKKGN